VLGDVTYSTRRRERKAAVRRCPVPGHVSKTSVRHRSSSATVPAVPATTSLTSLASGCRQSTHSNNSSRHSRRRSRLATCVLVSVVAKSASRRFDRPWQTPTVTGGESPPSYYNRWTAPFLPYISVVCTRCCLLFVIELVPGGIVVMVPLGGCLSWSLFTL